MNIRGTSALQPLTAKARDAAALLKLLANEQRLLILCHLVSEVELSVGALGDRLELSQSALSQHLARLREQDLVTFRRQAQTLYYRVSDPKAEQLLELLRDLFCPELSPAGTGNHASNSGHGFAMHASRRKR